MLKKTLAVIAALIFISGCSTGSKTGIKTITSDDQIFLDSVQYRSFLFFINEINPELGLVKDRTADWAPASIAAMGFALPAWAIGAEKGWIETAKARTLTLNMFRFLINSVQSNDTNATGYEGLYYHFLKMTDGSREWKCELSSIDTALLLAGIIFARNYYAGNSPEETEIRAIAARILERVNWKFMQMPEGKGKHSFSINLGYWPERGHDPHGWLGYNEAILIYILAAGMDMPDYQKSYKAWVDNYTWREPYPGLGHLVFPPLFGHQYSHMFIDFRNIKDDYMRNKGIDYFENSRRAVLTQRLYGIQNPHGWKGYDSLSWGITACDGPGDSFNRDGMTFLGYAGRGSAGPDSNYFDDGTLAPTALGGSIPFAPDITISSLKSMYDRFAEKGLWGRYGFVDAFNPTLNWFNKDYLGIDQGPFVIMIENYRNDFVWKYFMKDEIIKKGLERLNFR